MNSGSFRRPYGLMFHHFHGEGHPKIQGSLSADNLRSIIEFFGLNNILSAEDWHKQVMSGNFNSQQTCLTFDDSLRCQYDIALPILQDYDIKAFWFVYTAPLENKIQNMELYRYIRNTCYRTVDEFYKAFLSTVKDSDCGNKVRNGLRAFSPNTCYLEYSFYTANDKRFRFIRDELLSATEYNSIMSKIIQDLRVDVTNLNRGIFMDSDCLRYLDKRGHVIGLHSHSHPPFMGKLLPAEQAEEYQKNFDQLASLVDGSIKAMSHPTNSYNAFSIRALKDLGIRIGFRSNMAVGKIKDAEVALRSTGQPPYVVDGHENFEFPRLDATDIMRRMNR